MHHVQHAGADHRFTIDVDGVQGYVEYEQADGVMTGTHPSGPAAIGGRGIAGQLVQAALDHARGAGLKVVPSCSYADDWMRKHPEYEDLRA